MNVSNIETLNLNDSSVMGIVIRSGEVCFKLNYVDDYDSDSSSFRLLVFEECRSFSSTVNLDVEWPDSILQASETHDGEWRSILIEMNISASVFNVSCRSVRLEPFADNPLEQCFI